MLQESTSYAPVCMHMPAQIPMCNTCMHLHTGECHACHTRLQKGRKKNKEKIFWKEWREEYDLVLFILTSQDVAQPGPRPQRHFHQCLSDEEQHKTLNLTGSAQIPLLQRASPDEPHSWEALFLWISVEAFNLIILQLLWFMCCF